MSKEGDPAKPDISNVPHPLKKRPQMRVPMSGGRDANDVLKQLSEDETIYTLGYKVDPNPAARVTRKHRPTNTTTG